MKRGEKSGQGEEKQENLVEKLKWVGGGKRGGQTTPVLPSWRLLPPPEPPQPGGAPPLTAIVKESATTPLPSPPPPPNHHIPSTSARKLAATIWELNQYNLPLFKMHHQKNHHNNRRGGRFHHHHNNHLLEENPAAADPSPATPDLGSASSLRRHVTATLMQHHRAVQRDNHALQPVSPASFGSSMEVAPYNHAVTPSSSIDLKGGIGETSYSLKTSTELLKVLNRIWSLEEQHASNVTLVRGLKKELELSRAKIKGLVRARQTDKFEIDELMKQIHEDKQERVSSAVQSLRQELEDERKLRKRSETLHRKLVREIYEVKASFAKSLKDLDTERRSRKLLEELCDEFAWGIKSYEQETHSLKHKTEKDKDRTYRADGDGLILHISESWLDERMQVKQQVGQSGSGEERATNSVVEKLSLEIKTFLEAKRNSRYNRRISLESIPLNRAASAPQDDGEEDGSSASSGSHCFELEKHVGIESKPPQENGSGEENLGNLKKKKLPPQEPTKVCNPTSLQVKFKEQPAQANLTSGNEVRNHEEGKEDVMRSGEDIPVEMSFSKRYEICEEETEECGYEICGSASNYIDTLMRSRHLLSQNGNVKPENGRENVDSSAWRNRASPVRQWTTSLPAQDLEVSESSSKLPSDLKENTWKAKLLEARTRGQRSRSRLKGSKVSF